MTLRTISSRQVRPVSNWPMSPVSSWRINCAGSGICAFTAVRAGLPACLNKGCNCTWTLQARAVDCAASSMKKAVLRGRGRWLIGLWAIWLAPPAHKCAGAC
ncbi:hypothetical protein D3C80_988130 [compost metagenome]